MARGAFDYRVTTVRRRGRSLSLRVQPDGSLKVGAPHGTSRRAIDDFIRYRRDWIERQRRRSSALYDFSTAPRLAEGLTVHVADGPELSVEPLDAGRILISRPPALAAERFQLYLAARPLIMQRLNRLAKDCLPQELARLAVRYGLRPTQTKVRFLRSRWGSCTAAGVITLNSQLVRLDQSLRRYVMLHELCHLAVPNHSADFHRRLEEMLPEARTLRRDLRRHKLMH